MFKLIMLEIVRKASVISSLRFFNSTEERLFSFSNDSLEILKLEGLETG